MINFLLWKWVLGWEWLTRMNTCAIISQDRADSWQLTRMWWICPYISANFSYPQTFLAQLFCPLHIFVRYLVPNFLERSCWINRFIYPFTIKSFIKLPISMEYLIAINEFFLNCHEIISNRWFIIAIHACLPLVVIITFLTRNNNLHEFSCQMQSLENF